MGNRVLTLPLLRKDDQSVSSTLQYPLWKAQQRILQMGVHISVQEADGRGLHALSVWTTCDTCKPITYPKKKLRPGDREMPPALRGSGPDVVVVGGGLVGAYLWLCGTLRTLRHTGERPGSPSHCHQDDFSVEKEDGWCLSFASDTVNLIPCKRAKSLQWLIVSMINCLRPIPKLIFISTILSSAINIFHFALRLLIKPVQHLLK